MSDSYYDRARAARDWAESQPPGAIEPGYSTAYDDHRSGAFTTGGGMYGSSPRSLSSDLGAIAMATDNDYFGKADAFGEIGQPTRSVDRSRSTAGKQGAMYGARVGVEDYGFPDAYGTLGVAGFSPGPALADASRSRVGDMAAPGLAGRYGVAGFAQPGLGAYSNFASAPGLPSRNPNRSRVGDFAQPGLGAYSNFASAPGLPSRNPNLAMRGNMPGLPGTASTGLARLDGRYGTPNRTAAYSSTSRLGGPRSSIAAALSAPARQDPFGAGGWAAKAFGYDSALPGAGSSGGSAAASGFSSGGGSGYSSAPADDPFGDGGWASEAFGGSEGGWGI